MSKKEALFCQFYSIFQNSKEAALRAGYSRLIAEKTAQKLLARKDINKYLNELRLNFKKEQIFELAMTALKKIIFFRPNDAVILAMKFSDLNEQQLEALDLLQLSEIKKLKDGSFEFKFADRVKAIETLVAVAEKFENEDNINSFLEALKKEPVEKKYEQI